MRLVFALVLALAGVASGISPAAPQVAPSDGPARASQDCHCAMQSQPTTLAIRVVDRGYEDADRLDALGHAAFPVQPIHAALAGLAGADQVSPREALVPRRGYDATAPPIPPLA